MPSYYFKSVSLLVLAHLPQTSSASGSVRPTHRAEEWELRRESSSEAAEVARAQTSQAGHESIRARMGCSHRVHGPRYLKSIAATECFVSASLCTLFCTSTPCHVPCPDRCPLIGSQAKARSESLKQESSMLYDGCIIDYCTYRVIIFTHICTRV